MWFREPRASTLILAFFGISSQLAVLAIATPLSSLPTSHNTLSINARTGQPSPACDALLDIIDSYGTLEGTLGGAQILMPNLGEASTIIRQFMTLLDSATLNAWALFDAVPCKRYQAPVGDEGDGVIPHVTVIHRTRAEQRDKRQIGVSPTVVCVALARTVSDVTQTASFMSKLAKAKGLPEQLYLDPLQEAVDDAAVKIGVVEATLKTSNGC